MAEGENTQVDDQKEEKEIEQKEQTVKYATYDKAMQTVAKRGEELKELKAQLADLQNEKKANEKNIDPSKYQESLERENEELRGKLGDWQSKYETDMAARDKQDLDRTKLSAVWDEARKQGMVDDRDLLNFVEKDLIQVDENSVVNIKSVQTVVNKLKVSKPFFFQQPKPEKINDKAPDGSDETDISKLSLSEQLKRKMQA